MDYWRQAYNPMAHTDASSITDWLWYEYTLRLEWEVQVSWGPYRDIDGREGSGGLRESGAPRRTP